MRWSALSGVAFVACFALAVGLYGSGAGSSQSEVAAYYASHTDRLHQIGGFAALLAGTLFFLHYVAVLRARLLRPGVAADVALLSGAAAAALLTAANALWAATAFTAELEDGYRVSAATHLLVEDAAFVLFVCAAAAGIPLVLATAAVWLPRPLGWLGVAAAAGLAASYWYVPFALFLVWAAAGSLALARAPRLEADAPVWTT